MPIYEYVCSDCGHEIEKLQKMSDAPLRDCPACEQPSLKKKISAPGFRLSGSGWYETDFKSEKQKNLSKGDSAEKKAAAGSTDSKPGKSATAKGAASKEAAA
ncbi:MAG: zinc ribbon domain-containing protein [Gammaproteobacteria bacterium]|nr:zinc ribbon domain-containing protein [Gammaproteobacteria bacterium]